jgi:calcineurin-like phosphoesterase family protein
MNKVWVTSDLHFFHDNIIKHCKRPTTIENHYEWIIGILNSYIGENDTVYHVGDFAMGKNATFENIKGVLERLNGNWHFIIGNHDKENQLINVCKSVRGNHQVLGHYAEKRYDGKDFIMFHYPIENWNKMRYGSIHLHGHLHDTKTRIDIDNRINVCFDVEHKPYLFKDLIHNV